MSEWGILGFLHSLGVHAVAIRRMEPLSVYPHGQSLSQLFIDENRSKFDYSFEVRLST
jgi:hypothetical protein